MRRTYKIALALAIPMLIWALGAAFKTPVGTQQAYAASYVPTGDGGWEWVTPTPCGETLYGAFFLDATTGWVFGGSGTLLKTMDGGRHWACQTPGIHADLGDVQFTDKDHGWAAAGCILKTTNGGATWRKVLDGKPYRMKSVCFLNNEVGWAFGGTTLLKTNDGGETWSEQDYVLPKPGVPDRLSLEGNDVCFVDESTGWILDNSCKAYRTIDGGKRWKPVENSFGGKIRNLQFVDAHTGWIQTSTSIFRTTDGGATWIESNLDKLLPSAIISGSRMLWNFSFCDPQTGQAVCVGGFTFSTKDGGRTWSLRTVPQPPAQWPAVCTVDRRNAWVVGRDGRILTTSDGGATWEARSGGQGDLAHGVQFANPGLGWIVCSNDKRGNEARSFLLRSEDTGSSLKPRELPVTASCRAVSFVDEKTGWIAVDAQGRGLILKTTDGGETWQKQNTGTQVGLSAIQFVDSNNGWAAGNFYLQPDNKYGQEATLVKTTDGGKTWRKLNAAPAEMQRIDGMFFLDAITGWLVGVQGRIMKTTDGGKTWKRQPSGTADVLSSVYFVNKSVGWACGRMGLLLKTTDGGTTWVRQRSGTEVWLSCLRFLDEMTGWASGQGQVLRTIDGGNTWTIQKVSNWGTRCVWFTDGNNGWAVGPQILRTSTGGIPGAVWAKKQADGSPANFGHLVVTKKSEGYLLAEHPDSRIGIHIRTSDTKPAVGDYIYVHGKVASDSGEKIIAADSIDIMCAGWGILPDK